MANTHSLGLAAASSQYGTIADEASIRIVNGWSVFLRFKLTSLPGTDTSFQMIHTRTGENGLFIAIQNASDVVKVRVAAGSGSLDGRNSTSTVSTGTWYSLLVYFNAGSTKLLLWNSSGTLLETSTLTLPTISNPNSGLGIGRQLGSSSEYMNGRLDEIRVFNNDQTGMTYDCDEISSGTSGLQAYFKLNNAYTDEKGGNSITPQNTPTFSTDVLACPTNWTSTLSEVLALTATCTKTPSRTLSQTVTMTGSMLRNAYRVLTQTVTMIDNVLGSELAINGSFATDTDWTKEAGWTIAAGVATATSASGASIYENIGTAGHYYEITYTISGYVAGGLAIKAGDTLGTIRGANGTYVERITAGGSGNIGVQTVGVTTASIDNISVKEVTFAGFTFLKIIPKIVTDTVTMTASMLRAIGHVIANTVTITGTFLFNAARVLSDTVTVTASVLKKPIKVLSQVTTMSDTILRSVVRTLSNTITNTDTFLATRTLIRQYTQTVTMSDTFASLRTQMRTFSEALSMLDQLIVRLNGIVTNMWSKVARGSDTDTDWNKTPQN